MFPNSQAPAGASMPAKPSAPPMQQPQSGSADDQLAQALGLPPGTKITPETMQLAISGKLGPDVQKIAQSAKGAQQPPMQGSDPGMDDAQGKPQMGDARSIFGRGSSPASPVDDGDADDAGPMNAQRIFGRR